VSASDSCSDFLVGNRPIHLFLAQKPTASCRFFEHCGYSPFFKWDLMLLNKFTEFLDLYSLVKATVNRISKTTNAFHGDFKRHLTLF
jgi:hypothetical protein